MERTYIPLLWKRTSVLLVAILAFLGGVIIGFEALAPGVAKDSFAVRQKEFSALQENVLPKNGYRSKIKLGDAMPKLVEAGVIDMEKFEKVYKNRGGLTTEMRAMVTEPSETPITITADNANFLINLLWPLGIANKIPLLAESEAGKPENVNNLASTGGWVIGEKSNGGEYYNSSEIVQLTEEQEELVQKLASNMYRPCCGNSTAFPDCNHGAALLGLLELGASQGLSEKELYKEALKFNSFWFPDQYVKMATLFYYRDKKEWKDVDPALALSSDYSSGQGFYKNVTAPLARVPGFEQQTSGGGSCGV